MRALAATRDNNEAFETTASFRGVVVLCGDRRDGDRHGGNRIGSETEEGARSKAEAETRHAEGQGWCATERILFPFRQGQGSNLGLAGA